MFLSFYSTPSSHIEQDYHCDYKTKGYDTPHNYVVVQSIYSPEEETNHDAENANYHSNYKKSVFENFAFCKRIVILRNSLERRLKSSQSLGISELIERHYGCLVVFLVHLVVKSLEIND